MKRKILVWTSLLLGLVAFSQAQGIGFSMPNHNFKLIPGGGFESSAWVSVPQGDSAVLKAYAGPGLLAYFQPAVVKASQVAYLVVISTQPTLPATQTLRVSARCGQDSVSQLLRIDDANDGTGFSFIDSARYYFDTAFAWLRMVHPDQAAMLGSIENLNWTGCFPYPPLIIVTHHLFVAGDWRTRVLWHNTIHPYNWVKIHIDNEVLGLCWSVNIDTYGAFSEIPCESMHYTFQDTITDVPENDTPPSFWLFPNPCTDAVTVVLENGMEELGQVELFSTTGQLLQVTCIDPGQNWTRFETGALPQGIYFVRMGATVLKFLKL